MAFEKIEDFFNDDLVNEFLNKVKLFEMRIRSLIKEYDLIRSDSDSYILGNLLIYVYGGDRCNMTPHCHIKDKQTDTEIEVSLVDKSIVNVKGNKPKDWSYYGDIKKKFDKWCGAKSEIGAQNGIICDNLNYARYMWTEKNKKTAKYIFDDYGNVINNTNLLPTTETPLINTNNKNNKKKK